MKPGQILRLGQIEMRLETDAPAAPRQEAHGSDDGHAARRQPDRVGAGRRARSGFDTKSAGFSKKDNKGNKIFWIVAAVVGLLIACGLLYALTMAGK